MEQTVEIGPVLPLGICGACLQAFQARTLRTVDGGRIIGGRCAHNNTTAMLREFPDGTVGAWHMVSPASDQDLDEQMLRAAAVADNFAAARRAEALDQRTAADKLN